MAHERETGKKAMTHLVEPELMSYDATLRDWMAGQAISGVIADVHPFKIDPDANAKIAGMAYAIADAMLIARSK